MISEIGLLSNFTMVIYIDFEDFEETNSKLLRVWIFSLVFRGEKVLKFWDVSCFLKKKTKDLRRYSGWMTKILKIHKKLKISSGLNRLDEKPLFLGVKSFWIFQTSSFFFLISNFEFQEKPSFPIVKMTQKIQKINGIWVSGVSGAAPLEIPALSLESDAPP